VPVDPALYAGFIAAAVVAIISPGPDTMLIIRYTIGAGPRTGLAAVGGVQLGLLIHAAAAVLGLSLLIISVPLALRIIALAGAIYLAWIAWQQLREGLHRPGQKLAAIEVRSISSAKALRDAMFTNLLNPKVIVLFMAMMPGFVAPERGAIALQFAMLGCTMIAINLVFQLSLVGVAGRARRFLARPAVQRGISLMTAAIFFAFAIMIAVEHLTGAP
jgi:homoserine/homoserine lactone efflux protein